MKQGWGDVLAAVCARTQAAGSPHQRRLCTGAFKAHPSTPGQLSGRTGDWGRTFRRPEQGIGPGVWGRTHGKSLLRAVTSEFGGWHHPLLEDLD